MKIEQFFIQPQETSSVSHPSSASRTGGGSPTGGVSHPGSTEKMSFKTALEIASANPAHTTTGLQNKIHGVFSDYIKTWNNTESSLDKRLNKLNPDNRNLIEMQIDINNFNLKTLFLTQCAEACSGTIKRVQQMGNN